MVGCVMSVWVVGVGCGLSVGVLDVGCGIQVWACERDERETRTLKIT